MTLLLKPRDRACALSLLLAVSSGVLGCASKDSDDDSKTIGPVDARRVATREDFLAVYGGLLCGVIADCGIGSLPFGEGAECERQLRISAESSAVWNTPSVSYDPDQAAACINAIAPLVEDCTFGLAVDLEDACGGVFSGDLGVGAACEIRQQCQHGLVCNLSTSCPGTCQPLPGQGTACPDFDCAEGLTCIYLSTDGNLSDEPRCETRGAEGVECGDGVRDCQTGLACTGVGSEPGVCRPAAEVYPERALGEPCRRDDQCDSDQFCSDYDDGICAARLNAGADCSGTETACALGHQCVFDGSRATCQARLPEGAACSDDSNLRCLVGDCVEGSCSFRRALGESCTEDSSCYSYSCVDGVCVLRSECGP